MTYTDYDIPADLRPDDLKHDHDTVRLAVVLLRDFIVSACPRLPQVREYYSGDDNNVALLSFNNAGYEKPHLPEERHKLAWQYLTQCGYIERLTNKRYTFTIKAVDIVANIEARAKGYDSACDLYTFSDYLTQRKGQETLRPEYTGQDKNRVELAFDRFKASFRFGRMSPNFGTYDLYQLGVGYHERQIFKYFTDEFKYKDNTVLHSAILEKTASIELRDIAAYLKAVDKFLNIIFPLIDLDGDINQPFLATHNKQVKELLISTAVFYAPELYVSKRLKNESAYHYDFVYMSQFLFSIINHGNGCMGIISTPLNYKHLYFTESLNKKLAIL